MVIKQLPADDPFNCPSDRPSLTIEEGRFSEAQVEFADALRSFLIALRARGPLSPRTIGNHVEGLELFHRRFPGSMDSWNRDHVRLFLANDAWSAATQLIRWKALDAFFRFCVEDGILTESPMSAVARPRGGLARRPPILSEEDVELLLRVCCDWTWIGARDRAIITMFWTTPFRLSELAGLTVSDVDFGTYTVTTQHSKGGKPYPAVLFAQCAQALNRYLNRRPFKDAAALFVTQRGEPMGGHAIQQLLGRLEKKARDMGFTKHIYAHAWRHQYGMRTVRWGLGVDESAKAMGQRSGRAAEIYRQWNAEDEALAKIRKIAG